LENFANIVPAANSEQSMQFTAVQVPSQPSSGEPREIVEKSLIMCKFQIKLTAIQCSAIELETQGLLQLYDNILLVKSQKQMKHRPFSKSAILDIFFGFGQF
jgi:hypothetical protein